MANKKSRVWTFMLYPEDEGTTDLLNYLSSDNVEGARGCYIFHNGEYVVNPETGEPVLDENGEPKRRKDHIHCMVEFPNPRSREGVQKALCFDLLNLKEADEEETEDEKMHHAKACFPVTDRVSMYLYFLHWTYRCSKEGKQRYKESDIKLFGNESADFVISCSYEKEKTARVTCAELLGKSDTCKDERELLRASLDDEKLVKFIMKNPYFVSKFIIGDNHRLK